jgi:hypothetical protein
VTEQPVGPSGPGTVVMELGAGIGALVLYTPPGLDGTEIEISRDGEAGTPRTHSRVRARHVGQATSYAAVYPGLAAGQYTVWADGDRPVARVTVTGGQVASCDWPVS